MRRMTRTSNAVNQASILYAVALAIGVCLTMLVAPSASAACTGNNDTAGSVTFSPPAVIMLPANLSPGTIIWTSPQAVPGNPVTLKNCSSNTISGLENAKWGSPTGTDQTLFPTIYPWLSYRILHPDETAILHAWPNESVPQGNITFSVGSALEFVITGTVPPGSHALGGGLLTQWDVDTKNGSKQTVERFNITTSTISFVPPTCTLTVDPTVVTLPAVTSVTFAAGYRTTAKQTPFDINLNCKGGSKLSITLSSSNEDYFDPGVIDSTGSANSIGIQILDANQNPITWDQAIPEGITPDGPMSLLFYAQYFATWQTYFNPVTVGTVTATATYTLTYQ